MPAQTLAGKHERARNAAGGRLQLFLPARAAALSQVKQSSRPFDWPLQLFRSPPIRPLLTTAETNSEAFLTFEGLETEVPRGR